MNNLFKTLFLVAPALAVLFFFVVVKQSEHQAYLERESARFDKDFSEMMKNPYSLKNDYWTDRQKQAAEEEKQAQAKLEERRQKVKELESQLEKAFNETSNSTDLEKRMKEELK